MTNTIQDITQDANLILLIGSNPEEAHPVFGMQIRQAVQRGAHLLVADPRNIDLSQKADIHLKLKPGTNVAFVNGMMHIIIEEGLQNQEFIDERTENYEELKKLTASYTAQKSAASIRSSCGKRPGFTRRPGTLPSFTAWVSPSTPAERRALCLWQIWLCSAA